MNNAVIVWLLVFAVAALLFFGVAAVVSVKGFADLLDLLRNAGPKKDVGSKDHIDL